MDFIVQLSYIAKHRMWQEGEISSNGRLMLGAEVQVPDGNFNTEPFLIKNIMQIITILPC